VVDVDPVSGDAEGGEAVVSFRSRLHGMSTLVCTTQYMSVRGTLDGHRLSAGGPLCWLTTHDDPLTLVRPFCLKVVLLLTKTLVAVYASRNLGLGGGL
jgi:hypothetical protein